MRGAKTGHSNPRRLLANRDLGVAPSRNSALAQGSKNAAKPKLQSRPQRGHDGKLLSTIHHSVENLLINGSRPKRGVTLSRKSRLRGGLHLRLISRQGYEEVLPLILP